VTSTFTFNVPASATRIAQKHLTLEATMGSEVTCAPSVGYGPQGWTRICPTHVQTSLL